MILSDDEMESKYTEALALREQGKTYPEIGERFRMSPKAASSMVSRARLWKLRKETKVTNDSYDEARPRPEMVESLQRIEAQLRSVSARLTAIAKANDGASQSIVKPPEGEPPTLWIWALTECRRAITDQSVCRALNASESQLNAWLSGAKLPPDHYRKAIKVLLATLWARESPYDDFDDLVQTRHRIINSSTHVELG